MFHANCALCSVDLNKKRQILLKVLFLIRKSETGNKKVMENMARNRVPVVRICVSAPGSNHQLTPDNQAVR